MWQVGRSQARSRSVGNVRAGGAKNRWQLGPAVVLLLLVIILAACGGSTTTATSHASSSSFTTTTVSVPAGWTTYTYGAAAISVPSTWAVEHNTNCPDGQAVGTLLLGIPKVLESCPAFPASATYVAVSTPSTTSSSSTSLGEKPTIVNGIPVYLGFGSPSSIEWSVPAIGVQIYGTGAGVEAVLNTLHRAS